MVSRGSGDWMLIEEAGARVVVLCIGSPGARVGDNSVIVREAETVIGWGRRFGMVVKSSGARAC